MIQESLKQKCRDTKRKALKKEEKGKEEEDLGVKKTSYCDSDNSE
jgi:hypothetical protein